MTLGQAGTDRLSHRGARERSIAAAFLALLIAPAPAPGWRTATSAVELKDVTLAAGIRFTHNAGKTGKKWLPETMGAGVAIVDFNQDGWPDVFLVNGKDWSAKGRRSLPALYRNNRNGTFTDVTTGSGLDVEMYGMGTTAGDFDNDGRADLYVTALEGDRLFRNIGGGKFQDVTRAAGINNSEFGTSAAFLDFDRDGKLDLFVANYVQWNPKLDLWCSLDGATKSYCTPESYKGTHSKLYRGAGDGRFQDVSTASGVGKVEGKALGVTIFDIDNDGWPDIFVANDTQPNQLWRNNRNGTFTDIATTAGVAFSEDGVARGAMGADAADYDRSGRQHLLVGNFTNQMLALYRNEGNGLFIDEAPRSTVGRASLLSLTFGAFFFDYDLDGRMDIFCANGHIDEEINRVQPKVTYRQPPLLFHNAGNGKFENASRSAGADFTAPLVARGAAYFDFDNDGDLDLILTTNNGPARLYRNDRANGNNWLRVRTIGSKSNRDGIGAVIRVESASGTQSTTIRSGSSYCSQSELTATFGLGSDVVVKRLEVAWPSGTKQAFQDVRAGTTITIHEASGIAGR